MMSSREVEISCCTHSLLARPVPEFIRVDSLSRSDMRVRNIVYRTESFHEEFVSRSARVWAIVSRDLAVTKARIWLARTYAVTI